MIAMLFATSESYAQAVQPRAPALPPLSVAKSKALHTSTETWNAFLAQLPRMTGDNSQLTSPRFVPTTGGTWEVVTAAPAGGLCNPLLLTDGTVMAHDCNAPDWWKLTPDINGDYASGTWTQLASLPVIGTTQYEPLYHASAVLPDGRVVIMGGEYNGSNTEAFTNLGAIYDPLANIWTAVSQPSSFASPAKIGDAQSVVLANGTWMLGSCCDDPDDDALFNATTLGWTATGAPNAGLDYQDEQGYELLPNGNVLTIDIWTDSGENANPTNAEQYSPGNGSWSSAAPLPVSLVDPYQCGNFEIGPAALRPDGTLVGFGGNSGCASLVTAEGSAAAADPTAIYDSSNATWTAGPKVPSVCTASTNFPTTNCTLADAPAAVLPDGNILFAASSGYAQPGTHFFEFSSATSSPANSITQVSDPINNANTSSSFYYNFLVLPSGQILMTDLSNEPEIYTPTGTANPSWAPSISEAPAAIYAGGTYTLQGNQIAGLSQGGYYGDDVQTASNYPIVQITNNTSGHVFYARTFGHSSMSIAPSSSASTNFTVPLNIEPGADNSIRVIANGIPSDPVGIVGQRSVYAKAPNFNGNGGSDIVWHNQNGGILLWLMNGNAVSSQVHLGNISNAWQIVGTGDFNADGVTDLLLRNAQTGAAQVWLLNTSGAVTSKLNIGSSTNAWTIVGTGDFNGDGVADILWLNWSTGTLDVWFMNTSGEVAKKAAIGTLPAGWTIAGAGDFNGDHVADILARNAATGAAQVWYMNTGGTVTTKTTIGNASSAWTVAGTGDFNGDGITDILWQENTGTLDVWFMNHVGTVTKKSSIGTVPPSTWAVVGTGDFDANGVSDILFHDTSGVVDIWFMNTSGTVTSKKSAGSEATSWTVVQ